MPAMGALSLLTPCSGLRVSSEFSASLRAATPSSVESTTTSPTIHSIGCTCLQQAQKVVSLNQPAIQEEVRREGAASRAEL